MATVAPQAGNSWFVYAIAYPSAPSTSVPLITTTIESGTTALAGPFASQAQAAAWVAAHPQYFGPGKTNIAPPSDTPVTSGIPGASNPLSGVEAIGNFFNKLGQKNTWIRIGEGVVALILLDVGLKAFTGHSVIETTGKTITGAGKAAVFK